MAPYIFLPIYLAKLAFLEKEFFLNHDIFCKDYWTYMSVAAYWWNY